MDNMKDRTKEKLIDGAKDGMLPILNPLPIEKNEFEKILEKLRKEIYRQISLEVDISESTDSDNINLRIKDNLNIQSNLKCKDNSENQVKSKERDIEKKLRDILNEYREKPYYFKKYGKYLEKQNYMPSIKDVAHFYVLINYLIYGQEGASFNTAKYYGEFFNDEWDNIKEFIYKTIVHEDTDLFKDVNVDVVSGSVYKIKKYFMENNKIKDIRGASAIIKYINEDVTLDYLDDKYIKECAIYCGGGNVLIIAPRRQGKIICGDLEKRYTDISLTAQNAFECISSNLNELLLKYNSKMFEVNQKLEERKKIKIYEVSPYNDMTSIKIDDLEIDFSKAQLIKPEKEVCHLCAIRDGKYNIPIPDDENTIVCPSCLRKNYVGRTKTIFYDEYRTFTGASADYSVKSVVDIKDSAGNTAIIYADGNNMGNVIRNINTPFEHMYFSRTLDYITKKCVYDSIYSAMGKNAKFEVIALGGDDIFIIVPGNTSLEIASNIIKEFDQAFNHTMTMSAGICIAKANTPIKNTFEIAQHMLKNAKRLSREISNEKGIQEGTVDIEIIQSNININLSVSKNSLFPATNTQLEKFIKTIRELKSDKKITSSQLHKLSNASRIMNSEENPKEFQLFYLYQVSKTSPKYTYYVSKLFDGEEVFHEKDACFCGLIQRRDNSKDKIEYISPWNDIVLLWDAIGGE